MTLEADRVSMDGASGQLAESYMSGTLVPRVHLAYLITGDRELAQGPRPRRVRPIDWTVRRPSEVRVFRCLSEAHRCEPLLRST